MLWSGRTEWVLIANGCFFAKGGVDGEGNKRHWSVNRGLSASSPRTCSQVIQYDYYVPYSHNKPSKTDLYIRTSSVGKWVYTYKYLLTELVPHSSYRNCDWYESWTSSKSIKPSFTTRWRGDTTLCIGLDANWLSFWIIKGNYSTWPLPIHVDTQLGKVWSIIPYVPVPTT